MNLVFVHGWGCDKRIWQPLLDALSARPEFGPNGSIAVLELPGFGNNSGQPWPGEEALLQQLYEQLPQSCLLVGHSLGGMLAARLAALPGQEKYRRCLPSPPTPTSCSAETGPVWIERPSPHSGSRCTMGRNRPGKHSAACRPAATLRCVRY
ncbi:alpha/beta fold hydrolase [Microbulbifer taiwanensis]|uniref:alpha/beta fold hydrolase n=1 Tax=Microbulbifer taiwanensis TaxID=986746 RepID=UPI003614146F